MGRTDTSANSDDDALRRFTRAVLDDIRALDQMCDEGRIESGIRRVGAEQEMFLVDASGRPAPIAMELLERLDDPSVTTELARFNLEFNLPVQTFGADVLGTMHRQLTRTLGRIRDAARDLDGDVLLTGILPSLEVADLTLSNLTPKPRYLELNRVMTELSGGAFHAHITGLDEFNLTHDNVMLEACNTSFQLHFQVSADEFARFYNLAQVVTAPLLAAAANSPVLLRHRLWRETRIALFQQSLDVRSEAEKQRAGRQRVWFGDAWVEQSVVEIFRDDVARFPILIAGELGEPSSAIVDRGEVPRLDALRLHTGTVYRWNRACYGIHEGRPHLRIENRALPAGPSIVDAVANAAFFFGLMAEFSHRYRDVREHFTFDHVKTNFVAAARYGLNVTFLWDGGRQVAAPALILGELLPGARAGLERHGVPAADIDTYLGVIEQRVASGRTGAEWLLEALERLSPVKSTAARYQLLTRAMLARQQSGDPVHAWSLPRPEEHGDWRAQFRTVAQVMTTDLFTVQPEDSAELAASIMYWKGVRHLPVEDADGQVVGLLTHRSLLRLLAEGRPAGDPVPVRDIMRRDPVAVAPDASCLEAVRLMRTHKISGLPVMHLGRLVGIITDHDFGEAAATLLEDELGESDHGPA
jgi:CBS domain-containing protein